MLTNTTDNCGALEAATRGLEAIDRYLTGDGDALTTARKAMQQACRADSHYYLPLYYLGLIDYLENNFEAAASKFQTIAEQMPEDHTGIKRESERNTLFARNSQWVSAAGIFKAADLFPGAAGAAAPLSRGYEEAQGEGELSLIERALQARDSTVDPIIEDPGLIFFDAFKRDDFQAQINKVRDDAKDLIKAARKLLKDSPEGIEPAVRREQAEKPLAIALDALARAGMRYTDYFGETENKIATLNNEALNSLKEADGLFAHDWVIYCDLGACHLRLGHWSQDLSQFETARNYLYKVSGFFGLKPRYNVALFQIGRTYRLGKQFHKATHFFNRALKARDTQNISAARIERELRLTSEQSTVYP